MKRLHRRDLYCWSVFNERLNIDFNSFLWVREGGNVVIDPLPLTAHDKEHLKTLGGIAWIVLTNSDHARGARELAAEYGAALVGPDGERDTFPLPCARWLRAGEELVPGLRAIELSGSKTPRELALLLDSTTLISGDLIRAHRAGSLMLLLPEQGLKDREQALASVESLTKDIRPRIEAVLVGDGWCVFRDGGVLLDELLAAGRAT
jgi:glyoxylase-like metal-dependent hydrolase (beta-lactamase superfamily II)